MTKISVQLEKSYMKIVVLQHSLINIFHKDSEPINIKILITLTKRKINYIGTFFLQYNDKFFFKFKKVLNSYNLDAYRNTIL